MAKTNCCNLVQSAWEKTSSHLVHFVEKLFFKLGVLVARHPWRTIVVTWCFLLCSTAGLLKFHIERNPIKLWVPPDSDFYIDTHWYIDKFGSGFRKQKLMVTAENVLDNQVLLFISNVTDKVNSLSVNVSNTQYNIQDLCFKVPIVNLMNNQQTNQSANNSGNQKTTIDYVDYTLWAGTDFYCSFLEDFPYTCLEENILNIWKNDKNVIENLTVQDIVKSVNSVKKNPVSGHPMDYTNLLGGVNKDEHGTIITAKSLVITWYTYVNMSDIDFNQVGNLVGTEEWVTLPLSEWENEFLDLMASVAKDSSLVNVYYESGRSFGDISGQAMFHEMDKLFIGILLMFFYIQFALSRCNWLEIRFTLGSVGLLCVGMAYVTAVSWCSAIGVPFGPVHSSLPFLLMGLGVDDMFVIKACWEQLSEKDMKKTLPTKVGLMLKHAGVSIVITSFTDIVALLIGAITILPSLKSFCIYAAAGVFFIFCYSVTFYVALFTLDVRRIEANRNGIFYCYTHKKPIAVSSQKSIFQKWFTILYEKFIFTRPVKFIVIIGTLLITGFSVNSLLKLEQRFDPMWFIPEGTYYKDYLEKYVHYYPDEGNDAMVFLGEMEYHKELNVLYEMVDQLEQLPYVEQMSSWVKPFHMYTLKNYDFDFLNSTISLYYFNSNLTTFLFSPIGGRFKFNFKFEEPLKCGKPASKIIASSMMFKLPRFNGPAEYIPAMNHIKTLVKSTPFSTGDGYRSIWSKVFANWVTDEVISVEVERNIELALLCVMVCTVVLITNLQMCVWIFLCVLLTIVNVLGFMQLWGMTVDIVCCIGLELAIGLCVDYSAHVGHTFLTISEGTRSERALKTVTSIGLAVLLGGGSTLLSLSLLSMSKAYTFQSFFKIFLLVIIFGLFNGLVFLPTVLSLIGPKAYIEKEDKTHECVEMNGKKPINEKNQKFDEVEYSEVPT